MFSWWHLRSSIQKYVHTISMRVKTCESGKKNAISHSLDTRIKYRMYSISFNVVTFCSILSLYVHTNVVFVVSIICTCTCFSTTVYQVRLDWLPLPCIDLIQPSQLSCLGSSVGRASAYSCLGSSVGRASAYSCLGSSVGRASAYSCLGSSVGRASAYSSVGRTSAYSCLGSSVGRASAYSCLGSSVGIASAS